MKIFDSLREETLPNGLNILLLPEDSHELVTYQVWYKVGSRFEADDTRGLSHFIEHLFFKGSENYGPGEIDRALNEIGAYNNAATSKDYTFYYTVGTSSNFEKMFEIQTDMLLRPEFNPVEVDKERDVVLAEIHRANDTPSNLFYYRMMSECYQDHPYSHPVLGYESIIENIPVTKIRKYFEDHYHPKNMTVVIAGNFNPDQAMELIQKDFGPLKSPDNPFSRATELVPHISASHKFYANTQRNFSSHFWTGPESGNTRDILALDLLSSALTDGKSTRFKKLFKEDLNLVESISFGLYTSVEQGPLMLYSIVKDNQTLRYREVMQEQLNKLRKFYISREEFHLAREWEKNQLSFRLMKMSERAQTLGFYSALNSLDFCKNYLEKLDSLSLEDIVRVIDTYMKEEPSSLEMFPEHSKDESPSIQSGSTHEPVVIQEEEIREGLFFVKYKSGLELYFQQDEKEMLTNANLYIKNFAEFTARFPPGTAYLTQKLISRGTARLSPDAIAEQMDQLGARYGTICPDSQTRKENYRSFLMCRNDNFDQAFDLFSSFFTSAVFPEKEVQKARESILAEIKAMPDSLSSYCIFHLYSNFFKDHPFGVPFLGTKSSVESINRKDIEELYNVLYNPNNLVLVMGGPQSLPEIKALVEGKLLKNMGNLDLQLESFRVPEKFDSPVVGKTLSVQNPKEQAYLTPLYLVPGYEHPDYFCAVLLSDVLGGGMSSRYFRNMRDEKSYGYEIGTRYIPYMSYGVFFSYLGTDPNRVEDASQDFQKEIKSIQEGNLKQEEVDKAIKLALSRLAFSRETLSDRVGMLGNFVSKGLELEFLEQYEDSIKKVSCEDMIRFAKTYLNDPFEQRVEPPVN